MPPRRRLAPPLAALLPMNARTYFDLMDAIAAARTADELETTHARVASINMHPFERRALERQLRTRELALQLELEFAGHTFPRRPHV